MASRDCQLRERHDPSRCARIAGGGRVGAERLDARVNDPVVDDADAAGQWPPEPVQDRSRRPQAGVRRDNGIVGIEDERPVDVNELGQAPFGRPVALERTVAIEVIGGHVRVDGDRRATRQRRQLQLRQLDDHAMVRCQLRQPLDERDPDVPPENHRVLRVGGKDRGDERRGRRLALRPGHPDRRAPDRGAGTGPPRIRGPEPSGRRRCEPRRAPGGPPAAAARWSDSRG